MKKAVDICKETKVRWKEEIKSGYRRQEKAIQIDGEGIEKEQFLQKDKTFVSNKIEEM